MIRKRKRIRNKNRAWDTPTHVWLLSTRFAAAVMLLIFGFIVHAVLQHHCRALHREIGRLESEQRALVEKLARDRIRWNQLKTPGNLENALSRHGIAMGYPAAPQVVHMQPGSVPGSYREGVARAAYAAR